MHDLTRRFRQEVEQHHLACWNMSDYAVLCWLSAGGTINHLKRLWSQPAGSLSDQQRLVVDVLKEKTSTAVIRQQAGRFVQLTTAVASGSAHPEAA